MRHNLTDDEGGRVMNPTHPDEALEVLHSLCLLCVASSKMALEARIASQRLDRHVN